VRRRVARLVAVTTAAGSRFFAAGCTQHAAGIAYRVLFSLAPLAIVLVSVFGLVLQDDELRERVTDSVLDRLPVDPAGREDVESAIEAIASPTSAVGLLGLLLFLWAASGMMGSLRRGLEAAMAVERGRPPIRAKLVDLVLVAGVALLVVLSVALGAASEIAPRLWGDSAGSAAPLLTSALSLLIWVSTALALYRFVPAAHLRFADALAGAVVTALLLLGLSLASDLVYARTTDWSVIYGSLTSLLVFLYSVYLAASVLLLGGAVAAVWSDPPEPSGEALRTRVLRFLPRTRGRGR
jgi:membrane protein